MKKRKNTLVFIYNSFNDPLFQNLVLTYLKTLSRKISGTTFQIVTFEQPRYSLTAGEKKQVKRELAKHGMYWHPLTFHTGRWLLLMKAWDFIRAFCAVIYIRFRFRTGVIFAFANVAAAFSIVFAKLLNMKMIVYSYEPHSEFLVELGHWQRKSLKYRCLNYLEVQAGIHADYIMTGTKYMVERLKMSHSKAQLYRAPTAVDPERFYFDEQARKQVRNRLSIQEEPVVIYLGKFGDLYYHEEIPMFFKSIKLAFANAFFLIITPTDHFKVSSIFAKHLPQSAYHIDFASNPEKVRGFLSASDIGVTAIPPSPSQRYRSPTKVAEYLLCGLPYITTRGVSEDDLWAIKENVGVVIKGFSAEEIIREITVLKRILEEDKDLQRKRCREVGLRYRSKEHIDRILEEIYLGHEH